MSARLTPRAGVVLLAGLVALSTLLRFWGSRSVAGPWIAPDEMVYGLLGRDLWETGRLTILGQEVGWYSLLYPALVGGPLSLDDLARGLDVLQLVQALVMSLTAVVVYVWGRAFLAPLPALAAAALTVTLPALAYSGLVMTEALFLPVATLALWALARALAAPTAAAQLVFLAVFAAAVLTRMQALVLLPVFVTSLAGAALLGRDRGLVRRFWPTFAALGLLALGWLAWRARDGLAWSDLFGAYGTVGTAGYDAGEAARFVVWHLGGIFLLVAGVPLLALGVLVVEAARGREPSPAGRALVAVAASTVVWLALQVGVFASRYAPHLLERDLIVAAPPLFLALGLWLERGAPRPQPWSAVVTLALAVPALLLSLERLLVVESEPDAFSLLPLLRLAERSGLDTAELVWLAAVAAAAAGFVLVPRRFAGSLAVACGLLLVVLSVVSSREVAELSADRERRYFGDDARAWIDRAADGRASLVYDGNEYWPSVWHQLFWNRDVREVVSLSGFRVPGPLPQREVSPRFDGVLFGSDGTEVSSAFTVAPLPLALVGERLAELRQEDLSQGGLALWRGEPPARLDTWTTGVLPNGDFTQARVDVFDCGPGRLELTLIPKEGRPVDLLVDGRLVQRVEEIPADPGYWNGTLYPPADAGGGRCSFELRSAGLVGSTRLAFVRDAPSDG